MTGRTHEIEPENRPQAGHPRRLLAGVAILGAGPFRGNRQRQSYEVLHAFSAEAGNPSAALVKDTDGRLYGTHPGRVFRDGIRLRPDAGRNRRLHLRDAPFVRRRRRRRALCRARSGDGCGAFYGTTSGFGPIAPPTAFRMDASGNVTTLHVFAARTKALSSTPRSFRPRTALYGVKEIGGSALRRRDLQVWTTPAT